MMRSLCSVILLIAAVVLCSAQTGKPHPASFRLDSVEGLQMIDGRAEVVSYKGRRALHFLPPEKPPEGYSTTAILSDSSFKDGTIEIDVVGFPGKNADRDNRGFVGVAFRVKGKDQGEYFYLRPTNGRADDQVRRNHAVQYMSLPDYPWYRLRKENPGVYESYSDMEAAVWTHMKIVVSGTKARLYVNGASQPCLIVNDLKRGESEGPVALWADGQVEAYFSNLQIH